MNRHYFTSESVTEGHPDKVADRISDAILDAHLIEDENSRVAVETLVKGKSVVLAGEITSSAKVDIEKVVRDTIREVGYTDDKMEFSSDNCEITMLISKQSNDIAMGVDRNKNNEKENKEIGAGDQGMMFGYACTDTKELMPLAISLSHKLVKRLSEVRKSNILQYLRPDGKSQVTVEYVNDTPVRIDAVVLSAQHDEYVDMKRLEEDILREVIYVVIPTNLLDKNAKIYINPTGRFVIGGPEGDCGLTGRKIIVDTYGGMARHGGGCFSGKDATKVDRTGAYMARYIAKNVIAAKIADSCEVQIAYAIGVAKAVSVNVVTSKGIETDELLRRVILEIFDTSPYSIIENFKLKRPIFTQTSSYGHMGREDISAPWESVNKAAELRTAFLSLQNES